MASLTTCLKKAGEFLDPEDRAELLRVAGELRASGQDAATAAKNSITARLAEVDKMMAEGVQPAGKKAEPAQGSSTDQALAQLLENRPDMPVRLPGDEKTTTLAAAIERIREEQVRDTQMADLIQVAATCFLTGGAAI